MHSQSFAPLGPRAGARTPAGSAGGGLVDGEVVDLAEIRKLAQLPSRDELRAMFLGTLQAPTQKLAGTLNALLGYVRNALEARMQQLETS